MFSAEFGPLMGILGGGYYLHNITLPIVRNAKNPENNNRDLFIGYLMAFISYGGCGLLGLFGFNGSMFNGAPIDQNCLEMLGNNNALAIIVRICIFAHLITAMALLFAC